MEEEKTAKYMVAKYPVDLIKASPEEYKEFVADVKKLDPDYETVDGGNYIYFYAEATI